MICNALSAEIHMMNVAYSSIPNVDEYFFRMAVVEKQFRIQGFEKFISHVNLFVFCWHESLMSKFSIHQFIIPHFEREN